MSSPDSVFYNGYQFGEYSHVSVNASFAEDEAGRTVLYHRYVVRVVATIYPKEGDSVAGDHFSRIRRQLTKQGGHLRIQHQGFARNFEVNGSGGQRDVMFGPKPRMLAWDPVGEELAVEVIWECEFAIPTCEDGASSRSSGVMAFNYSIAWRIDTAGYTTRTIAGYIEIAMTRLGRSIPDTADAYRDLVEVNKPDNFQRETHWTLSKDKRRADFTVVDTEQRTPHPFPPDVINIRASHRVGWTHRQLATLPQTISATIELAQTAARGRAWEIFKAICEQRLQFGLANGTVFLEGVQLDEDLFGNTFNFALSYRYYTALEDRSPLAELFNATGIGSDLRVGTGLDWSLWSQSIAHLQSHRGFAEQSHNPEQDTIIDLCVDEAEPTPPATTKLPLHLGSVYTRFCNERPPADRSYIRFESTLETYDELPTAVQVTLGKDDLELEQFDPSNPLPNLGESSVEEITRFVESAAGSVDFVWKGYAERVGFPIPRPDKLTVGDIELVRKGSGRFRQKFLGVHLCQKVYAAAWNQVYTVTERPERLDYGDLVVIGGDDDFS